MGGAMAIESKTQVAFEENGQKEFFRGA